jgi:hypothetical protein
MLFDNLVGSGNLLDRGCFPDFDSGGPAANEHFCVSIGRSVAAPTEDEEGRQLPSSSSVASFREL